MSPELNAILRHLLTAAGGYAVSAGWFNSDQATQLVGGAMVLLSVGLSIWQKTHQRNKVTNAYLEGLATDVPGVANNATAKVQP